MESERIYILGTGAVGMALASSLVANGRSVTAVRTSVDDIDSQAAKVTIHGSAGKVLTHSIEVISLARLKTLTGIIVVTAKSYANPSIAVKLREKEIHAPIVIMQNGVGVENPYLDLVTLNVYRCVLYVSGQRNSDNSYAFIPITASPIGIFRGNGTELAHLVDLLNTTEFPFRPQAEIQYEVWKKATINAVFNSICPLLETDNGIFVRDDKVARLAREIVEECIAVMQSSGVKLSAAEIMQQIFAISERSNGQLISTLQDINLGRETEIEYLNLEIARIGEAAVPQVKAQVTRVLGEMVKIKSRLRAEVHAG